MLSANTVLETWSMGIHVVCIALSFTWTVAMIGLNKIIFTLLIIEVDKYFKNVTSFVDMGTISQVDHLAE